MWWLVAVYWFGFGEVGLIWVGICGLHVCWVGVRVSWFYGLVRLVLGVVCCWFAFVLLVLFVAAWVCGAV